ncbi:uncharacterized protein TNCV_2716451 [Trichonephila clavipes]|nr:uncharacterized protein TNCV_2716451 [Trichonephila clavipes]
MQRIYPSHKDIIEFRPKQEIWSSFPTIDLRGKQTSICKQEECGHECLPSGEVISGVAYCAVGPIGPNSGEARDLELEVDEDDTEELIIRHEDELTTELRENFNEEHEETQRNVSPSQQEENKRGIMPTSAIKDLLIKWADVRVIVLEWHSNQTDVSREGWGSLQQQCY